MLVREFSNVPVPLMSTEPPHPPRRLDLGHPEFAPLGIIALMIWGVVADGAVLRIAPASD